MYKVKLVVCLVEKGVTKGGYVKQFELAFVPCVGMKFVQGISTRLWETADGKELSPAVQEVIYDLDYEEIICLFTINKPLESSFWQRLNFEKLGMRCAELEYFRDSKTKI